MAARVCWRSSEKAQHVEHKYRDDTVKPVIENRMAGLDRLKRFIGKFANDLSKRGRHAKQEDPEVIQISGHYRPAKGNQNYYHIPRISAPLDNHVCSDAYRERDYAKVQKDSPDDVVVMKILHRPPHAGYRRDDLLAYPTFFRGQYRGSFGRTVLR